MSIPVSVFNSNQFPFFISVNGGNVVPWPNTGPGQNWQPQQPDPNPFSFSNGDPAPNVFGTSAVNKVDVYFARGPANPTILMTLPQNQSAAALQLYIFLQTGVVTSFMMLADGVPTAWNTITFEPTPSSDDEGKADCR